MNPSTPDPDDPRLRDLLRAAHPAEGLPPRFQENVWRRLERAERRAEATSTPVWLAVLMREIFRPAYAAAGLVALMLAGTWLGIREGDGRVHLAGRARYVAAVSPFQRTAP
ncbi:MAG: hypothetical protein WCP53_14980 [Verrucomicrobiota bacterium]